MNNVEKSLDDVKKHIDSLKAPEELEERLKNALESSPVKKSIRFSPMWKTAVVAVFFIMLVGYNYNAFAFYGKKLLGFDELVSGTLKELNEQGLGQIIDKRMTLKDGTELTINGMMADANQLIIYYTLHNPKGIEEVYSDVFQPSELTGFFTKSKFEGGSAIMNDDRTTIKGTMDFEPVSPFSKKLTLHIWQNMEKGQEGEVTFPYEPNKAMQTQIKQSIKKTITVDKGSITFDSISATPTSTVIKGRMSVDNFDRINLGLHGIELIANGKPVQLMGSGVSSSFKGSKFEISYDALPARLQSVQLIVQEFVGYEKLNEKISLESIGSEPEYLKGEKLWIKGISMNSQGVVITIATAENVLLDGVVIETKDKRIPLQTTINQTETKMENGMFLNERTLLFDSKITPEYLFIEGIHYKKRYNKKINIEIK